MSSKVTNVSLGVGLSTLYNDAEDLLELVTDNLWSGRLDRLNPHHLEFGFCVLDAFVVVDVQDVSFLRHPDPTIRDDLASHLHAVYIRTRGFRHLRIRLIEFLLEVGGTNLV